MTTAFIVSVNKDVAVKILSLLNHFHLPSVIQYTSIALTYKLLFSAEISPVHVCIKSQLFQLHHQSTEGFTAQRATDRGIK